MNNMIIFVKGLGFVMDFNMSGPALKFTMDPTCVETFETVQQVNVIIKVNFLHKEDCSVMKFA